MKIFAIGNIKKEELLNKITPDLSAPELRKIIQVGYDQNVHEIFSKALKVNKATVEDSLIRNYTLNHISQNIKKDESITLLTDLLKNPSINFEDANSQNSLQNIFGQSLEMTAIGIISRGTPNILVYYLINKYRLCTPGQTFLSDPLPVNPKNQGNVVLHNIMSYLKAGMEWTNDYSGLTLTTRMLHNNDDTFIPQVAKYNLGYGFATTLFNLTESTSVRNNVLRENLLNNQSRGVSLANLIKTNVEPNSIIPNLIYNLKSGGIDGDWIIKLIGEKVNSNKWQHEQLSQLFTSVYEGNETIMHLLLNTNGPDVFNLIAVTNLYESLNPQILQDFVHKGLQKEDTKNVIVNQIPEKHLYKLRLTPDDWSIIDAHFGKKTDSIEEGTELTDDDEMLFLDIEASNKKQVKQAENTTPLIQILNSVNASLYHGSSRDPEKMKKNGFPHVYMFFATSPSYAKIWGDYLYEIDVTFNKLLDVSGLKDKHVSIKQLAKILNGINIDIDIYDDKTRAPIWYWITQSNTLSLMEQLSQNGFDGIKLHEQAYDKKETDISYYVNTGKASINNIKLISKLTPTGEIDDEDFEIHKWEDAPEVIPQISSLNKKQIKQANLEVDMVADLNEENLENLAGRTSNPYVLRAIIEKNKGLGKAALVAVRKGHCPSDALKLVIELTGDSENSRNATQNPNCPPEAKIKWMRLMGKITKEDPRKHIIDEVPSKEDKTLDEFRKLIGKGNNWYKISQAYKESVVSHTEDRNILTEILKRGENDHISGIAAKNPNCPPELLTEILRRGEEDWVSLCAVQNLNCPPKILAEVLRRDKTDSVTGWAAMHTNCPPEALAEIIKKRGRGDSISELAARNPSCPPEVLKELLKYGIEDWISQNAIQNPNCPPETLEDILKIGKGNLPRRAAKNPNCPKIPKLQWLIINETAANIVKRGDQYNLSQEDMDALNQEFEIIHSGQDLPADLSISKNEPKKLVTSQTQYNDHIVRETNDLNLLAEILDRNIDDYISEVAAYNPNCSAEMLTKVLERGEDDGVSMSAASNINCPKAPKLKWLAKNRDMIILGKAAKEFYHLDPEDIKALMPLENAHDLTPESVENYIT